MLLLVLRLTCLSTITIINDKPVFVKGGNLKLFKTIAIPLDYSLVIVYNRDMNTKPQVLTKQNTKMLAVEASTHKLAKEYAARMDLPLYVAVAQALRVAIASEDARHAKS